MTHTDPFPEMPPHGRVTVTGSYPRIGHITLVSGWVHVYAHGVLESLPVHRVESIDWQAPKDAA